LEQGLLTRALGSGKFNGKEESKRSAEPGMTGGGTRKEKKPEQSTWNLLLGIWKRVNYQGGERKRVSLKEGRTQRVVQAEIHQWGIRVESCP